MDEKADLGSLTPDFVWGDQSLILQYLDNTLAAGGLPDGVTTMDFTDEKAGNNEFFNNTYSGTPDSPIAWWNYTNMRNINNFLARIGNVPNDVVSKSDRESYQGQILVLRAYNYWRGVNAYGGVPLILEVQDMPDDPKDLGVPRSKTSECIAQIIKDLDAAIALEGFPLKWIDDANAGRLSKSIAYVLKAKVLLNYASPRFTKETPSGTKSTDQRWTDAYNAWTAAKTAVDGAGYGLFRGGSDKSFDAAVQDYYDMYIDNEVPNNPEMIWVCRKDRNAAPSPLGGPDSHNGGSGTQSLQFTNNFLNADGSPFTALDPLISLLSTKTPQGTQSNPLGNCEVPFWQGREPRFYASVAFNGCVWPLRRQNEATEVTSRDPHQWYFEGSQFPFDEPLPYKSTTVTGIGIRKFVNIDQNWQNDPRGDDRPIFRYAELLLSLAECAAKTGKEPEAIGYLKQIRQRAGIPAANNYGLGASVPTGDALILTILNERAVELAFEGERFNDLYRWRLYTDELAGYKLNGTIFYDFGQEMIGFDSKVDVALYTPVLFNFPDITVPGNEVVYYNNFRDRVYPLHLNPVNVGERQYFWCVPYEAHIVKNPVIVQTKGWNDPRGAGTFDPYQ
jgi:hypothetical protein